jgi:DNA topoisomerase-1
MNQYKMSKSLIIVESPSKCAKIEKILGSKFKCLSSCGHIYELGKGLKSIDINNHFEPKYKVIPSKKDVINRLKKAINNCNEIFLASDPDREGEAIAYHLAKELNILKKAKRITFNEITASSIKNAIKNPKNIDMDLYEAQKSRRILDRLIGFEISPILWVYMSEYSGLSAGRCQSPALNLVYQRKKEIEMFKPKAYYTINGNLKKEKYLIPIKYTESVKEESLAKKILEHCLGSEFKVDNITFKESFSSPPPPFTTSTLQQDASLKLGLSPKSTMMIAQKLYENGLITYMRTDSIFMSKEAKEMLKNFILEKYGESYYKSNSFKSNIKNAQEAHECIRIVDTSKKDDEILDEKQRKLYNLIFKRSLACQMTKKLVNNHITIIRSTKNKNSVYFKHTQEEIKFEGYCILYPNTKIKLIKFKENDLLQLKQITATPELEKPKPRFTEASLIKTLEKSGIGRPSTFSNILSTLKDRNYITIGKDEATLIKKDIIEIDPTMTHLQYKSIEKQVDNLKGKLLITKLGENILQFLNKYFKMLIDEKLTSLIENDLDKIAKGDLIWYNVIQKFYDSFHPQVEKLNLSKPDKPTDYKLKYKKCLGTNNGFEFGIIKNKYGESFVKCNLENNKIEYLPIFKKIFNNPCRISINQLEFIFSLPKECGNDIVLYYGRNGFYIKRGGISKSIIEDLSNGILPPLNELEEIMSKKSSSKILKTLNNFVVMEGKYGPFLLYNKKIYKIPKSVDIDKINVSQCKKIISK